MSRAFFFAHYTAWAWIWGHVLIYYALFAHREWRLAGGRWRGLPAELGYLVRFTFAPLLGDAAAVVRRRPLPALDRDYHYTKAHRIGFFIAMAAVTYTLMGASFALYPDRSQWPAIYQTLTILLVGATSLAGLGHLFTALEHRPRMWRWFVAAILAWYPLAMVLYEAL